jgi:hypothetical protein
LADKDNPWLDVSAQPSFWLIYREHSLQQGARAHPPREWEHENGNFIMLTKTTLILLTIIVGIVWQTRLAGAVVGPVLINRAKSVALLPITHDAIL